MGRSPTDFKSVVYAIPPLARNGTATPRKLGGANRIRTGVRGFADRCLTTRPSRQIL